ncbi:hypothetical protein [Leuconostoc mesenteroides]|jgi:FKBP-type peptidyl-prolyl cis-trans isomerase (trigger factor)|uniref:hypothetical protein n=1 Tax=Leuconostoc mesenteroides TaxID=1245 RepID=UPI002361FDA2|nr:hypothetical protein [Leuconostoc mesenteroides]
MATGGTFYSSSTNENEIDSILNRLIRTIRQMDTINSEIPLLEDIFNKVFSNKCALEDSEKELLIKIIERRIRMQSITNDRVISEFDSLIVVISNLKLSDLNKLSVALDLIEVKDINIQKRINNLNEKIGELISKKK